MLNNIYVSYVILRKMSNEQSSLLTAVFCETVDRNDFLFGKDENHFEMMVIFYDSSRNKSIPSSLYVVSSITV